MWDELYEEHYPELLNYCTGVCHDRALAEDLAQEVFMKALQNADTFEDMGRSQRRAWLFRALKNLLMDSYRKAALEAYFAQLYPDEVSTVEPGFSQTEAAMLLQKLPQEDRLLFQLRYLEDYNASELSEMFGLPRGTIRSKLSRSRKILKAIISEK